MLGARGQGTVHPAAGCLGCESTAALPGAVASREGLESVGVPYEFETLAKLAQEHGDAYYVLHPERFQTNLRALAGAFRAIYSRTAIGYSYKTNYTPLLCRLADQEGCYAEVVSKMEYDLALRLGVSPGRIIFNGPLKAPEEIEEALLSGALVNLEDEDRKS